MQARQARLLGTRVRRAADTRPSSLRAQEQDRGASSVAAFLTPYTVLWNVSISFPIIPFKVNKPEWVSALCNQ